MSLRKLLKIFRRPEMELDPLDAYALWAENYPPEAHNSMMKIEEQAMIDLLPELKNKIVLDLACGSGRYMLKAKEQGASAIFGLDFSLQMLARARDISDQLVLGNMEAIPFESDSIDVVICGLSIGHVPDLEPVYREISRILSSNGVMVCSDIHPFGQIVGWKRKFHASNGREYAVKHHFHLYTDHHIACTSNQLRIEDLREPRVDQKHRSEGLPAIFAIRARKTLH